MQTRIPIDSDQLAEVCRRHHIKKLWLFGSVLREDFRADSDVDVIVEFEPGQHIGFFKLFGIEEALSQVLGGRKIDLCTSPRLLNRWIKDQVMAEAQLHYDQE
jgi:hypothetical protein